MSFIVPFIFLIILFAIITGLAYGIASLLAYIFESLTLADTFTPAILLMILTVYLFIQAMKIGDEVRDKKGNNDDNEFDDEPVIVFPSRRQFKRKLNRKRKKR